MAQQQQQQALEAPEQCVGRIQKANGDWFAVLGVALATATPDDVKAAYRRIVLAIHPDKCQLPGAADAFNEADKAYKNLKDKETLDRFQNAHRRMEVEKDYRRKRAENSSLEKNLRAYQQRTGVQELQELENKISSELTPQERERKEQLRAKQEFFYKHERLQREKDERQGKLALKRVQEEETEGELQDTISSWRSFQQKGKLSTTLPPVLKQNVGMVRVTKQAEEGGAGEQKDYLLRRKSWQDANRWRAGADAPAAGAAAPGGGGWRAARDAATGRDYWWDDTGQTTWTPPPGAPAAAGAAAAGAGAPQYPAAGAPQYPSAGAPQYPAAGAVPKAGGGGWDGAPY